MCNSFQCYWFLIFHPFHDILSPAAVRCALTLSWSYVLLLLTQKIQLHSRSFFFKKNAKTQSIELGFHILWGRSRKRLSPRDMAAQDLGWLWLAPLARAPVDGASREGAQGDVEPWKGDFGGFTRGRRRLRRSVRVTAISQKGWMASMAGRRN